MSSVEEFVVPEIDEDALPLKSALAAAGEVIAAVAAQKNPLPPGRFAAALAAADRIGERFGEPSLVRILTLRALASPQPWKQVVTRLKKDAATLGNPERAFLLSAFEDLLRHAPRIGAGVDLAMAMDVPATEGIKLDSDAVKDISGGWTSKTLAVFRSEPAIVVEARQFALDFGGVDLMRALADAQREGGTDFAATFLSAAVSRIRDQVQEVLRSVEAQRQAQTTAQGLEDAADRMESVARQRSNAISRRAKLLKRHLGEDLQALAQDALEEFEADLRRANEKKGWFGKLDTEDLNERVVVKNLDRRYLQLARRYQDQLDLLEREVSEFCDEFTRVGDEALRPIAQHEFRSVAPHPRLDKRLKASVDRGTTRSLVAGTVGALATGAAVQGGLMTGVAVVGFAVTPIGAAVLGVVAVSAAWKVFSNPGERNRHDLRERTKQMEERLRAEVLSNLPRFEQAVDAVVARFTDIAVSEIQGPRSEAHRLREIARVHIAMVESIAAAAEARLTRLTPLLS